MFVVVRVGAIAMLIRYSWQTIEWILNYQCYTALHKQKKLQELQTLGTARKDDGTEITESEIEPELPSWPLL